MPKTNRSCPISSLRTRVIERLAYCLLAVWAGAGGVNPPLRGGDKHGHFVRNKGRANVRKRGDLGGALRAKGGQKGVFGASKGGKRALFGEREGKLGVAEGFLGQKRTICPFQRPPQINPQGPCERCDRCESADRNCYPQRNREYLKETVTQRRYPAGCRCSRGVIGRHCRRGTPVHKLSGRFRSGGHAREHGRAD